VRTINFIKGKIDGKELEEGMMWKELYQTLKEKVKVEDEVDGITWIDLILLLYEERSFFSLRKDSNGRSSISKMDSSKKVLDYFFEKAWKRPILKSRPSIV
jgi:hypothetical protein